MGIAGFLTCIPKSVILPSARALLSRLTIQETGRNHLPKVPVVSLNILYSSWVMSPDWTRWSLVGKRFLIFTEISFHVITACRFTQRAMVRRIRRSALSLPVTQ